MHPFVLVEDTNGANLCLFQISFFLSGKYSLVTRLIPLGTVTRNLMPDTYIISPVKTMCLLASKTWGHVYAVSAHNRGRFSHSFSFKRSDIWTIDFEGSVNVGFSDRAVFNHVVMYKS